MLERTERPAILVCGKCTKRLRGGFGPRRRTPLAAALKRHFGIRWWRKGPVDVIETRCLGVCPRGAVTMIVRGETTDRLLVGAGTDIAQVVARAGI